MLKTFITQHVDTLYHVFLIFLIQQSRKVSCNVTLSFMLGETKSSTVASSNDFLIEKPLLSGIRLARKPQLHNDIKFSQLYNIYQF
jgi:hypothetical protein